MKTDLSLRDHQSVFMGVLETKSHVVFLEYENLTDTSKTTCHSGKHKGICQILILQKIGMMLVNALRGGGI